MPKVEAGVTYPRDIASPVGLPAGWKAVETTYSSSSKFHGSTYIRFMSGDGKYRHVSTLKRAVELDARDRGIDVQQALLDLKKKQQQRNSDQELQSERKRPASSLSGSAGHESEPKALKVFEGESETVCMVCRSSDDESQLLLCDAGCLQGMHFQCCTPPLAVKPEGEWLFPDCAPWEEVEFVEETMNSEGRGQQTSAACRTGPRQDSGGADQLKMLRATVLTGELNLEVLRSLLAVEEAHQIVDRLKHQVSSGEMSSKTLRALADAQEDLAMRFSDVEATIAASSTSKDKLNGGQGSSHALSKFPRLEKIRARLLAGDCEMQVLRALLEAVEAHRRVEQLQQQVSSGDMSPDTLRALASAQEALDACDFGLEVPCRQKGDCGAELTEQLPQERQAVAGFVASSAPSAPEMSVSAAAVAMVEVEETVEESSSRTGTQFERHQASRPDSDWQVRNEEKHAAGSRAAASSSSTSAPKPLAPADEVSSKLAMLESMGFSGQHAKNALESSQGNLDTAVAMLLSLDQARESVGGIVHRT
eukprot:TRINITY_DN16661_c0_g2_i1.p1 TRINITY_DN16661_c0_g2~~TRINITY_DN16661_c0_g2_i1.p1  ORF type:complete len:535 (+),score=133.20 TRINITY_DN16661_c0_g2_i1:108-1712(+)